MIKTLLVQGRVESVEARGKYLVIKTSAIRGITLTEHCYAFREPNLIVLETRRETGPGLALFMIGALMLVIAAFLTQSGAPSILVKNLDPVLILLGISLLIGGIIAMVRVRTRLLIETQSGFIVIFNQPGIDVDTLKKTIQSISTAIQQTAQERSQREGSS